jgi:hypothetical protein
MLILDESVCFHRIVVQDAGESMDKVAYTLQARAINFHRW